jgi:L-alanine-DL-glutamate epimerase-like enolase superfamily enzyme
VLLEERHARIGVLAHALGGVDIIMPDLQKTGRLGEGQRIANLANLYYVPFAPHMVRNRSSSRALHASAGPYEAMYVVFTVV